MTITEFLLGDACFGSAANLNVSCRLLNEETQSALYTTMVYDCEKFLACMKDAEYSMTEGVDLPPGWDHVRYGNVMRRYACVAHGIPRDPPDISL